jgi:hypothetical protein
MSRVRAGRLQYKDHQAGNVWPSEYRIASSANAAARIDVRARRLKETPAKVAPHAREGKERPRSRLISVFANYLIDPWQRELISRVVDRSSGGVGSYRGCIDNQTVLPFPSRPQRRTSLLNTEPKRQGWGYSRAPNSSCSEMRKSAVWGCSPSTRAQGS